MCRCTGSGLADWRTERNVDDRGELKETGIMKLSMSGPWNSSYVPDSSDDDKYI